MRDSTPVSVSGLFHLAENRLIIIMENNKSSFSIRAGHCSECECVKLYLIISKHSSCFCVLVMTNHCQESTDISIGQCFHPFFLAVPKAGDHFLLRRFYLFPGQSSNHLGTLLVFPQYPQNRAWNLLHVLHGLSHTVVLFAEVPCHFAVLLPKPASC